VGVVTMGYRDPDLITDDEKQQARQLADRFTVALSNARLVMNLDQMSWGTLLALARAIDASSPWTAGHSERVTALSLAIGRRMGMTESELEVLQRGGLLHDLGKIGVPADILDKHGRLTDEEMEVMMGHTRIGARILQPIPVFPDVIPIVQQHHEHVDGTGYPDGLKGDEISLGARVLAVADVYDALTSARPYRKAMEQDEVVKIIQESSGSHFDPEAVEAFLEVIRSGEGIPTPEYTYISASSR
jgi:putative nucleotidyltransferase with HDIG domain